MRDHDTGGWRFAHTIGLIQHTTAAHCAEEMWAIAEMNSNWKVWLASLIESKNAESQIIFWSRRIVLVLVGLSHRFHVSASCQMQDYCRLFSFFSHGRMERSLLSAYFSARVQNELSPPIWGSLSPRRLSWCLVSTAMEAWNAPRSQAVQYFILSSSDHLGRRVCLAAAQKSMRPGTHVHVA